MPKRTAIKLFAKGQGRKLDDLLSSGGKKNFKYFFRKYSYIEASLAL